jgi:hypothetical protein
MNDPRDYKLEISSVGGGSPPSRSEQRPFLSVHFACCNVYRRIYRNKQGNRYEGACPRCGRIARFSVGPGGTAQRSFVVE